MQITGAGIFLINLILLWLPSRYLLKYFQEKTMYLKDWKIILISDYFTNTINPERCANTMELLNINE